MIQSDNIGKYIYIPGNIYIYAHERTLNVCHADLRDWIAVSIACYKKIVYRTNQKEFFCLESFL